MYLLYLALRTRLRQNLLLLLASYFFYGAWDWRFLSLIWISTLTDYWVGRALAGSQDRTRKKLLLALSLTINLGLLGFFKYFDFGLENMLILLDWLGFQAHPRTLGLILPVGISFYTFQTIGYTVDVYRGRIEPAKNLLDFALYVAFFPQLVAGPIERAERLLPQFQKVRRIGWEDLKIGFHLVLLGYFFKVALADTLAPFVDFGFARPDEISGITSLICVLGFTLQIYGDFAGYSLIARGTARLMGIRLMENFHLPYLALDPRDFWRRWHISLSTWLRDYLYIPLGGNRAGKKRTCLNILIVMLLGGLWHGAGWSFVLWGLYHGLLLIAAHAWIKDTGETGAAGPGVIGRLPRIIITFVLVMAGWLIFRAENLGHLGLILANMVHNFTWGPETAYYLLPTLTIFVLTMVFDIWREAGKEMMPILRSGRLARLGLTLFLALTVLALSPNHQKMAFIYFQF